MTEQQKQIQEAYLKEVGDKKMTKKDIVEWFKWMNPTLRESAPRLKPDRQLYQNIVPRHINGSLPPVQYTVL